MIPWPQPLKQPCSLDLPENNIETKTFQGSLKPDFTDHLAEIIHNLNGNDKIDGIIIDNKLGILPHRVPAIASRLQHCLVQHMHSEQAAQATGFKDLMELYESHVDSFAFDINTLADDPGLVKTIAQAYIRSGKQRNMVSVYLRQDHSVDVTVHKGGSYDFTRPDKGIVDARTRTHGCFADYIQAVSRDGELFGEMNGKGVFLYATRGATHHINALLSDNHLTINDMDLLIEHQANFAMLPLTLQKVLDNGQTDPERGCAGLSGQQNDHQYPRTGQLFGCLYAATALRSGQRRPQTGHHQRLSYQPQPRRAKIGKNHSQRFRGRRYDAQFLSAAL